MNSCGAIRLSPIAPYGLRLIVLWVAPYREIFEVIDSRHPPDWVTEFGDDGERYSYPAPLNEASVARMELCGIRDDRV